MPTDFTLLLPLQVCQVAPGDAQKYIDQITGYVLWGVGVLFLLATGVGTSGLRLLLPDIAIPAWLQPLVRSTISAPVAAAEGAAG